MRFKIEEGNHLLVPVSIGVSAPRRNALNNMMEPVPDDVRGIGLIDTGASLSVVYRPIIEKLRLSARGFCSVYGFSLREGEDIKYPNYDISLAILDAVHDEQKIDDEVDRIEFRALQAVSPPCSHVEYDMLIGMDVLSSLAISVHGPGKWFELNEAES